MARKDRDDLSGLRPNGRGVGPLGDGPHQCQRCRHGGGRLPASSAGGRRKRDRRARSASIASRPTTPGAATTGPSFSNMANPQGGRGQWTATPAWRPTGTTTPGATNIRPYDLDNLIPAKMADLLGIPCKKGGMVLEGGSIDSNGAGLLLTTENCLLNPNRNPEPDESPNRSRGSSNSWASRRCFGWAKALSATTRTATSTTSPALSTRERVVTAD